MGYVVTQEKETGRWYLVRHGETEWSREGRIQGHADAGLSDSGRQQMHRLAKSLAGRSFSAAYASDLSRAIESARTILEGRGTPIQTDADLREFSYGTWEGLTAEEAEARDPQDYVRRMAMSSDAFAAPEGEDTHELLNRVRRFCDGAFARHEPSEDVLVVAHGGSIRALLVCLLEMPDDMFWRFKVDRGSLSIVSNHPGGRVLELCNEVPAPPGDQG